MPFAENVTRVDAVREPGVLPARRPQAFIVLGPHRSGTSAATRLLNLLGADIADDLLPPAPDNQSGFWESRALVDLHDEVLSALGARWHSVRALDREACVRRRDFVERLQSILRRDYDGSGVFVVKDPRMCRLLPLWRSALATLGIEPSCFLVLRNPHEVAASLAARDGLPLGKGLLIWLWHVLDAEMDSRGLARTVVSYDEILADWRAPADRLARELGFTWTRSPRDAQPDVERFLCADLRHQVAARLPPATHPLAPIVNRVYAVMVRACQGEPLDQSTLDAVRDQLRAANEIWAELDADASREHAERAAHLGHEIGTLRSEVERRDRLLAALEESVADKEHREAELAGRIADLETSLAGEERRSTERAREIEVLEHSLTEETARSDERVRRIAELEQWRDDASRRAALVLSSPRSPRLLPWLRAATRALVGRVRGGVVVLDRATRRAVEQSGLFDPVFYLVHSPDLCSLAIDPYFHFLHWGALEGRDPHPLFDSSFYLEANPDVAAARINPLLHYWRFGAAEGRNPHPLFDTRFYLDHSPSAGGSGANPLAHYLRQGALEGRRAHPHRDAEARARLGL